MNNFPLKNWIPYKLTTIDGQVQCHWLNTFEEQFTEPFFDETILKCKRMGVKQAGRSSVSDLSMIKEWATDLPAFEPAALIFHISRCGSTLISQLLATSNQHIVLAEVPFFDDVLRLPFKDSDFNQPAIAELLVAAIKYYGQRKTTEEKHLFIKLDSWHIFFYKQLRQLYPLVPFILIYRNPAEVFGSHKKIPGMQAVPGLIESQLFGFKEFTYDADIYLANVLERYLEQYLEIIQTYDNLLLVNYNEGPMPVIRKIALFTNIDLTTDELSAMEQRSRYHSKKPGEPFAEKALTYIPPVLNRAMRLYAMLEEKRMAIYGVAEK